MFSSNPVWGLMILSHTATTISSNQNRNRSRNTDRGGQTSSHGHNPTAWDCGTCPHRNFCCFRKPCFVSGTDAQRVPAQCHAVVRYTLVPLHWQQRPNKSNHGRIVQHLSFQRGGAAERWKLDACIQEHHGQLTHGVLWDACILI